MAVKQLFIDPPQFVDSNGNPYSGALLFFYAAGSSTKQDTFTTSSGSTACDNPITLNSAGYPSVSGTIVAPWGTVGQTYKIGLAAPGASDPPASFIWTVDNVSPINDTSVSVDQWVAGPTPTYISATSFSLVGDQTSTFHVGRRVKTTNSGGTIYSTIVTSAYGVLTTVTVVNDSGTLDSGLSAVSYGLLSASNSSVPGASVTAGLWTFPNVPTSTTVTTGGSSTAYTLTPSLPLQSLLTGASFRVKFHTASGATPTIAVSGLTAKSLKYRNSAGSTVAVTSVQIPTNWTSNIEYDGTDWIVLSIPPANSTRTRQVFTSGSGTYTTPAGVSYINVRLVGGGGGGGSVASGTAGGNTTFSTLTGSGGAAGTTAGNTPPAGGAASGGDVNIPGGGASGTNNATAINSGSAGGNSAFGGGGGGGAGGGSPTTGGNAATNSGSGGGGGGSTGSASASAGGGAGGYVEKVFVSPSATYSYAVGSGGGGATGGAQQSAGGNGAAGIIIVDEFYF